MPYAPSDTNGALPLNSLSADVGSGLVFSPQTPYATQKAIQCLEGALILVDSTGAWIPMTPLAQVTTNAAVAMTAVAAADLPLLTITTPDQCSVIIQFDGICDVGGDTDRTLQIYAAAGAGAAAPVGPLNEITDVAGKKIASCQSVFYVPGPPAGTGGLTWTLRSTYTVVDNSSRIMPGATLRAWIVGTT